MTRPPIVILLSPAELDLIIDGLDADMYWSLSDMRYRDDGHVLEPGSDDPEKLGMIVAVRDLIARFEKLRLRSIVDESNGSPKEKNA